MEKHANFGSKRFFDHSHSFAHDKSSQKTVIDLKTTLQMFSSQRPVPSRKPTPIKYEQGIICSGLCEDKLQNIHSHLVLLPISYNTHFKFS